MKMTITDASSVSSAAAATNKQAIRQELESAVKLAVSSCVLDRPLSGDITQAICTVIESILIHGLRDAFFLKGSRYSNRPAPNFWPFVSKYTHRSIKQQIAALNQIKSEVGKARAWIRIVLSEHALEHYINLFSKDTQINQFYHKTAFIRDPECIDALNGYLKALGRVNLSAPINSSLLNGWTPTPLILAGLISGKVIKLAQQLRQNRQSSASLATQASELDEPEPEVAMNALDLLTPPGSSCRLDLDEEQPAAANKNGNNNVVPPPPPLSLSPTSRMEIELASQIEDDESILSHPSMLEESYVTTGSGKVAATFPFVNLLSSTPEDSPILPFAGSPGSRNRLERLGYYINGGVGGGGGIGTRQQPWMDLLPAVEHTSEVVVHRRKTARRRELSRSSDEENSRSRSHSTTKLDEQIQAAGIRFIENPAEVRRIGDRKVENNVKPSTLFNEAEFATAEQEIQQQPFCNTHLMDNSLKLSQGQLEMFYDEVHQPETNEKEEVGKKEQPPDESNDYRRIQTTGKTEEENEQGRGGPFEVASPQLAAALDIVSRVEPTQFSFGTSLQEELNLTSANPDLPMAPEEEIMNNRPRKSSEPTLATNNGDADDHHLHREQFWSPTVLPTTSSASAVGFGGSREEVTAAIRFSWSTGSSSGDLPATFDEALREFLHREGSVRRQHCESNKRLFSESSSNGGGAPVELSSPHDEHQQQQNLPSTSKQQWISANIPADVNQTAPIQPYVTKAATLGREEDNGTLLLCRDAELPQIPFDLGGHKKEDDEDQLIDVPLPLQIADRGGEPPYFLPRKLVQLTQLAREEGLDKQDYRCKCCRRNIGAGFGPFKICALTGQYNCDNCFRSSSAADGDLSVIIPARAVLNGDFQPRPVSKAARVLLKSIADQPFLRVDLLNPQIYDHCRAMQKAKELRTKLALLVMYLLSCKNSVADDIKRRIWPQGHLHTDIHLYSFADLESVANGTLERRLNSLISFALSHVQSCALCLQKGFICELCSSARTIYPFQTDITHRCPGCSSVFHRDCALKAGLLPPSPQHNVAVDFTASATNIDGERNCPKCMRRARYSSSALQSLLHNSGCTSPTPPPQQHLTVESASAAASK